MNSDPNSTPCPPEKCKPVSPARAWGLAARPKTLMAAVCPVAVGTLLAASAGGFHAGAALAALLGAVFIQIGTNFANDYLDHAKGADRPDRKGPPRAVASGWISSRAMGVATGTMFLLALAMMGLLTLRAGAPMVWIGLASVACGIWYTAGKYALAYIGLGDLFVIGFFGPVAVGGTFFAQVLPVSLSSWWPVLVAGLGPGLIANGLLVINNLRDVHEDRRSNKRTLAVRFGVAFSRWEYAGCLVLGCAMPGLAALLRPSVVPSGAALTLLALLAAYAPLRGVWTDEGVTLNRHLGGTARTLALFTLLFALGMLF